MLSTPVITAAAPSFKLNRELAAVRQATAKYRNVNAGIAAGYMPTEACSELSGQGGMGFHYVHPQLARNLESDPLKPEVLLYASSDDGLTLIGVEDVQADGGQE